MSKYSIPNFLAGYASGKGHNPEYWIDEYVVKNLPDCITTVVDFGCANGRNFIPFSKYKCIGFDIHDLSDIVWFDSLVHVEYYCFSIEDFIKHHIEFINIDWENSLVMTHGTLMYLYTAEEQNNFIDILKQLKCKNFVFHEYGSEQVLSNLSDHARNGGVGWLSLNENNQKMFDIFRFRDFENDMCAFISLKK